MRVACRQTDQFQRFSAGSQRYFAEVKLHQQMGLNLIRSECKPLGICVIYRPLLTRVWADSLGRGVAPGRGATRSCAALFIGRRCACCPLPPEMARLRHEQQRQHAALCQLQHADTAGQPDYGLSQVCCGVCWEGALGGATLRLVQPPALALTTFQRPQPLTSALVVPAAFASAAVCRRSIR